MESFFGEHIPLTEQILVPTPDYFVKMAELVKNADPRYEISLHFKLT